MMLAKKALTMRPIALPSCGLLLISVFMESPSPCDAAMALPSMFQSISRAIATMARTGTPTTKSHIRRARRDNARPQHAPLIRNDAKNGPTDHQEPHRQAAQEQRQPRALEPALQIAIAGVAHLAALDERLRPRISEPERDDDDHPANQRVEGVAPRRGVLVEAQTAEPRARQPITPRPIERIFAEQRQQRKAD